jgi:beta-phosphoglucomutase-like phosphatase (HAD superfamily)
MRGGLRGVFLDFDGTIAETERSGQRVAYNRAFAELGLDWTWSETLYGELLAVAGGKERLNFYLQKHRPELVDDPATAGLVQDIHRAKVRHFATIAPTIPLRRGILRLVREAHAEGVVIAIATTASKPGVEALLGQCRDLPGMVGLIAANEAVERKKPAPDVYLWALERLGLDAGDCVAIEDSNVGLQAALAAKLPTIITVSDYSATDDFTGARAVLSDLGERDAPARCLSGARPANGLVDLAFLRTVRAEATAAAASRANA